MPHVDPPDLVVLEAVERLVRRFLRFERGIEAALQISSPGAQVEVGHAFEQRHQVLVLTAQELLPEPGAGTQHARQFVE